MALTLLADFAFKHADQTDTVSGSPTTFKTNMDSQAKDIRDFLNGTHKTEIDTHLADTTTAHGAVSAATANKIIIRDAAGRAKVVAPSAEDDIALKSNITAVLADYAHHYYADGEASDDYSITPDPAISAYAAGQTFNFKANTANTGACTLNVNAKGAKTIKKNVSDDLATGDIVSGQIITVVYDGTNFQMISHLPTFDASETVKGIVELATAAETTTGTSDALAVHPKGLKVELDKKAVIVQSTYVGNGSASKDIAVGFTPKIVFVYLASGGCFYFITAVGIHDTGSGFATASIIQANGFKVSTTTVNINGNGATYNYIAIG
jgi:exosome complex RNA-binding protein Csl4